MSSPHDIVTIKNISTHDFTFEYDRASGNYPYTIPAGQVKRFPRFLAEHAVKHLIDQVLNDREMKTNNQVMREQLASQIVIDEESFQQQPQVSEAERTKERVEQLNVPSELEAILKKRREAAKKEVVTPAEVDKLPPAGEDEPAKEEEKFEGLSKVDAKSDTMVNPVPQGKTEVVPPVNVNLDEPETIQLPNREQLYDYAVNTLKIELTDKVRKLYDSMPVKKLVTELDFPLLEE